jgi:hypothetical protein
MRYTFVCDPDECDALLEFIIPDGKEFPSEKVEIVCPCGKDMHWIGRSE